MYDGEEYGEVEEVRHEEQDGGVDFKGPPLSREDVAYIREIDSLLQENDFEDESEAQLMLENFHRTITGREYRLAVNKHGSLCLQRILGRSSPRLVRRFFSKLSHAHYELWTDRNASHVVEGIIMRLPEILKREQEGVKDELPEGIEEEEGGPPSSMSKLFMAACVELAPYWLDVMCNTQGSYLLRTLIKVLCGQTEFSNKDRARGKVKQLPFHLRVQPQKRPTGHVKKLRAVLRSIIKSLEAAEDEDLVEMMTSPTAAPVMVAVLQALSVRSSKHSTASLDTLVVRVLQWKDAEDMAQLGMDDKSQQHVDRLLNNPCSSHLLEAVLTHANDALFNQCYTAHFRGNLEELSMRPLANFCVQRLLGSLRTKRQAEACFDELQGLLPKLLERNRAGVVWQLVGCCVRHAARVKQMVESLALALGVKDLKRDRSLAEKLLTLPTRGESAAGGGRRPRKFPLNGTLILQELLGLPEGSKRLKHVQRSVSALSAQRVLELATDSMGSRVLDAVLASGVAEKTKLGLADKLKGKYAEVALSLSGGFFLEKLFKICGLQRKINIANELVGAERRLQDTRGGKTLLKKLKLETFKHDREHWVHLSSGEAQTAEDMFANIIGESEGGNAEAASGAGDSGAKKSKKKRKARGDGDTRRDGKRRK